jgi:hypothetical protein
VRRRVGKKKERGSEEWFWNTNYVPVLEGHQAWGIGRWAVVTVGNESVYAVQGVSWRVSGCC